MGLLLQPCTQALWTCQPRETAASSPFQLLLPNSRMVGTIILSPSSGLVWAGSWVLTLGPIIAPSVPKGSFVGCVCRSPDPSEPCWWSHHRPPFLLAPQNPQQSCGLRLKSELPLLVIQGLARSGGSPPCLPPFLTGESPSVPCTPQAPAHLPSPPSRMLLSPAA